LAVVRRLSVELVAKSDKFGRDMKSAGAKLDAFGKKATAVGRTMTRRVTLPLLAAAGAMVKVGVTFDEEMTKVITLVGIADEQVNRWREDILKLGPAVGRGPTELARALFVVTSAGERGADALEIVESAAKAAAIGLGDTAVTARTVTAAMQAYKKEGLTAARATDILVATVRQGNLVAEDLAGSLGRVLGIAAQVGVSFDQVGGFIATFSRLGVSAEESATALRQILTTMLKPTRMTATALETVGLSSKKLRAELGERGLASVLNLLIESFKGNDEMLAMVIPNVRALSGVLGTAGAQGEAFAQINRDIAKSLAITADGFRRVQETPAFKWRAFRAEVEKLSIELGARLIPIFEKLLGFFGKIVTAFTDLNPKTQKTILMFAGLAAAAGPLVLIMGGVASAFAAILSPIGLVVTAIAVLGGSMISAKDQWSNVVPFMITMFSVLVEAVLRGVETILIAMEKVRSVFKKGDNLLSDTIDTIGRLRINTVAGLLQAVEDLLTPTQAAADVATDLGAAFEGASNSIASTAIEIENAADVIVSDFSIAADIIQDRFIDSFVDNLSTGFQKAKNIVRDFVVFAVRELARVFVARAVGSIVGGAFGGPVGAVAGAAAAGGAGGGVSVPLAATPASSGVVVNNQYVINSTFGSKGEREAIVREITRIQEGL